MLESYYLVRRTDGNWVAACQATGKRVVRRAVWASVSPDARDGSDRSLADEPRLRHRVAHRPSVWLPDERIRVADRDRRRRCDPGWNGRLPGPGYDPAGHAGIQDRVHPHVHQRDADHGLRTGLRPALPDLRP